jgi:hypothetical protein
MNGRRAGLSALYRETLAELRDPAVRDLLWLLASPSLLADAVPQALAQPDAALQARIAAWLVRLDGASEALHAALAATPQKRLGHYAERLLAFFLESGLMGRLIAANLPLRRGNQTLGECDFLLEAEGGSRLHWELAVKCYLYVPGGGGDLGGNGDPRWRPFARYVGPNLADRFDLKLVRMFDHQLGLSTRPEFAAQIGAGPWQAEPFLRGWLFYPLARGHEAQGAGEMPLLLGPDHLRGWWGTTQTWAEYAQDRGALVWRVLPRLQWMAPRRIDAAHDDAAMLFDATALRERLEMHFGARPPTSTARGTPTEPGGAGSSYRHRPAHGAAHPGPWLIAGFVRERDLWVEATRGFVVDDAWSERAQHYAASAV